MPHKQDKKSLLRRSKDKAKAMGTKLKRALPLARRAEMSAKALQAVQAEKRQWEQQVRDLIDQHTAELRQHMQQAAKELQDERQILQLTGQKQEAQALLKGKFRERDLQQRELDRLQAELHHTEHKLAETQREVREGEAAMAADPRWRDAVNIMLLGATGNGKSTFANRLWGDSSPDGDAGPFSTSAGAASHTSEIQSERVTRLGRELCVIDTPGRFDSREQKERQHAIELVAYLREHCRGGVHAFLLVTNGTDCRLNANFKRLLRGLAYMLGEDFIHHVIVVATKLDSDRQRRDFERNKEGFRAAMLAELRALGDEHMRLPAAGEEPDTLLPMVGVCDAPETVVADEDAKAPEGGSAVARVLARVPLRPYTCANLRGPLEELRLQLHEQRRQVEEQQREVAQVQDAICVLVTECQRLQHDLDALDDRLYREMQPGSEPEDEDCKLCSAGLPEEPS